MSSSLSRRQATNDHNVVMSKNKEKRRTKGNITQRKNRDPHSFRVLSSYFFIVSINNMIWLKTEQKTFAMQSSVCVPTIPAARLYQTVQKASKVLGVFAPRGQKVSDFNYFCKVKSNFSSYPPTTRLLIRSHLVVKLNSLRCRIVLSEPVGNRESFHKHVRILHVAATSPANVIPCATLGWCNESRKYHKSVLLWDLLTYVTSNKMRRSAWHACATFGYERTGGDCSTLYKGKMRML